MYNVIHRLSTTVLKKPLQPPYNGPFKVLKRDNKYFTLQFQDRIDTVSLDRLKSAHIDNSASSSSSTESTSSSVPVTSTPTTRVLILVVMYTGQNIFPNTFTGGFYHF